MILLALALTLASTASTASAISYVPPVDAPIIERFRPPACTWCPGNRGIDYATPPGAPVRASAGGVVTFSGSVAGDRFVVVAHADGLRTTYGYLATAIVAAGDRVVRSASSSVRPAVPSTSGSAGATSTSTRSCCSPPSGSWRAWSPWAATDARPV